MRRWLPALVPGLVALLGLGSAQAQEGQAFSLPLPSGDLPDGVLTIKVIGGGGMGDLKVGQEIRLERLEGDKVAESKSARAGSDGRARFEGLRSGASYRTSASALGKQLRSQPFAGPEKGGLRLLLSVGGAAPAMGGGAPASAPTGSGAMPPGHPPVGGAGPPGGMPPGHPPTGEGGGGAAELKPDKDLPDGTLLVSVRLGRAGKPLAGVRVHVKSTARVLRQGKEGAPAEPLPAEARTDAAGELRLSLAGPASAPASQPAAPSAVITVAHDGMSYSSTRLTAPVKGGLRAVFTVFAKSADSSLISLGPGSHYVVQVGEGALSVMQLLNLVNEGDRVFDPGPAGLRIPLPERARGAELPEELRTAAAVDAEAGELKLLAPIPPGRLMLRVFFEIPYRGAELELRQRFPIAAGETVLRLLKNPEVRVIGPALAKGELAASGDERLFPLAPVKAGAALELTLLDLPHRDRRPVWGAIALAIAVALWALIAGALGPRRRRAREARREQLLGQLVQLERGKKKNAEEVARRRRELTAELRQVWDEPW